MMRKYIVIPTQGFQPARQPGCEPGAIQCYWWNSSRLPRGRAITILVTIIGNQVLLYDRRFLARMSSTQRRRRPWQRWMLLFLLLFLLYCFIFHPPHHFHLPPGLLLPGRHLHQGGGENDCRACSGFQSAR